MVEGTIRNTETTASPEAVFAVASDVGAYPEWATGVVEAEVLETDAEGLPRRARFVIDGFVKRISYELEYEYEAPNLMSWRAIPGDDISDMEGSYHFTDLEGGGTAIAYALRVAPNFSVPGFLRRQAEKQIVSAALRGLKRRAEERASAE